MKILLAPMEGLLDHSLRDTLTRAGGIDLCVSEFIRVTDAVLPKRAFYRVVPECALKTRDHPRFHRYHAAKEEAREVTLLPR